MKFSEVVNDVAKSSVLFYKLEIETKEAGRFNCKLAIYAPLILCANESNSEPSLILI